MLWIDMDGDVGCDRMFSYTKDPICSILVVLEHSNKESIEVVVMIFLSPVETTCVTKKTRQDKQKYQVGNHLQHLSASFSKKNSVTKGKCAVFLSTKSG